MSNSTELAVHIDAEGWRLDLAAGRLLDERYEPRAALEYDLADRWPGDFTGRLLQSQLALEGVRPELGARADALVELVLGALNDDGVLGHRVAAAIDEQQVSGHGWLVAGLLAWSSSRGRPDVTAAALRMADAVLVPAMAALATYPRDAERGADGAASGHLTAATDGWLLSSDTFCVLIGLEGLVAAYSASRTPRYAEAIEQGARFLASLDLVGLGAQLHASLTAARCVLTYAGETGRRDIAAIAVRVYSLWSDRARTLDHQTWNWFGRDDTWTEPCAVVDALELASAQWEQTGEIGFLEDVELIAENGLAYAQNAEGGFSLSTVATASRPTLDVLEHDAYWCCTMRGALGIARRASRGIRARQVGGVVDVIVDDLRPVRARIELGSTTLHVEIETDYPASGVARLEIVGGADDVDARLVVTPRAWLTARDWSAPAGVDLPIEVVGWEREGVRYHGPQLLAALESGGDAVPIATRTRGAEGPRVLID